jgi:hypothetical protein
VSEKSLSNPTEKHPAAGRGRPKVPRPAKRPSSTATANHIDETVASVIEQSIALAKNGKHWQKFEESLLISPNIPSSSGAQDDRHSSFGGESNHDESNETLHTLVYSFTIVFFNNFHEKNEPRTEKN